MNNYKELKVWQKSVDFSVEIYNLTLSFPSNEQFGLTSQIRRAGYSIASNIAEGSGRESAKEFSHFLSISLGSTFEAETQLIIANRIQLIDSTITDKLVGDINEIQKMLRGLQKSLNTSLTT